VAASFASCVAAWSMSLMPSMGVFVLSRCLSLVADINGPIRNAILRDLFSAAEWEHLSGGVTGIKSRMAIFGTLVAAGAVAVGMGLLQFGDMGLIGLQNEYSKRKEECRGQRHCVAAGSYSWEGDEWQVDGLLRLLMIMGALAFSVEALLLLFCLPETLRKDSQERTTISGFVRESWRDIGAPWNNLRVFATLRLRNLTLIRLLQYAILSGGSAMFFSWYRRHDLDTLSMYKLGTSGGVSGFITLTLIIRLVNQFGDLCGIWIPANVLGLLYGISVALIPASHWQLSYIAFPLLGGTGAAIGGFTPELLAKLVPPDIQGTFQTAKAFLYDSQRAILVWPWLGLLICSEHWAYPFDCLPILVALALGALALVLTLRQIPADPKNDIREGRALDDFWDTDYVKGRWFQQHGGRVPDRHKSSSRPGEDAPKIDAAFKCVDGDPVTIQAPCSPQARCGLSDSCIISTMSITDVDRT